MPSPGDLIEKDFQAEVRAELFGADADFIVPPDGFIGFEDQHVRTADTSKFGGGTYSGVDVPDSFVGVLKVTLVADSGAELRALFDRFKVAWAPGGDVEFHWQLGGAHLYLVGRTRDYEVTSANWLGGHLEITAEFFAEEPELQVFEAA